MFIRDIGTSEQDRFLGSAQRVWRLKKAVNTKARQVWMSNKGHSNLVNRDGMLVIDTPVIDRLELWFNRCLLYTFDAADDLICVDIGGRRIINKNTTEYADDKLWPHLMDVQRLQMVSQVSNII